MNIRTKNEKKVMKTYIVTLWTRMEIPAEGKDARWAIREARRRFDAKMLSADTELVYVYENRRLSGFTRPEAEKYIRDRKKDDE